MLLQGEVEKWEVQGNQGQTLCKLNSSPSTTIFKWLEPPIHIPTLYLPLYRDRCPLSRNPLPPVCKVHNVCGMLYSWFDPDKSLLHPMHTCTDPHHEALYRKTSKFLPYFDYSSKPGTGTHMYTSAFVHPCMCWCYIAK